MVNNNNFDELFEKNKIFEKLEKNEKLDKNELDEIKNFSFELKPPTPKGEEFLLKEFLEALSAVTTAEDKLKRLLIEGGYIHE